jgi:hypothetical protein
LSFDECFNGYGNFHINKTESFDFSGTGAVVKSITVFLERKLFGSSPKIYWICPCITNSDFDDLKLDHSENCF